jgi:dipeptidyl aminopeptidase/acylaminoacyl peptidase
MITGTWFLPAHALRRTELPPIRLVQGVDDTKVLKSQSIELYRDLKAAGDQTQLVLVQNMGHMFAQAGPKPLDPSVRQIANDIVSFFDKERKA